MIAVEHIRSGISGVYIGRPSVLGNPYVIGAHGTREQVIEKYEEWLRDKLRDASGLETTMIHQLVVLARKGDVVMLCYCKPQACHGDVIKKVLEEFI